MDHACLTLTDEHQLKLHFEEILKDVDESDIFKQWNDEVSITEMPLSPIGMFMLKLYCLDWRVTDMKSAQCRNRMIDMIVTVTRVTVTSCFVYKVIRDL